MTAIRFTYSGTNYDFASEEIEELKYHSAIERTDVFWDLFGNAYIYLLGDAYKMFEITFIMVSRTAINNLAALYAAVDANNNPANLVLHWEYIINTSSRANVQMRRDQYEEQYFSGQVRYGHSITIQFYEKYSIPGLIQFPKLVRI